MPQPRAGRPLRPLVLSTIFQTFERSPPDWLEFIYLDYYRRFAKREIADEVERAFESAIAANPRIGDLVPGLGGLRKVRVALPGHGKRGGARFLYFLRLASGRV